MSDSKWSKSLTDAQRRECMRIMGAREKDKWLRSGGGRGFSVYLDRSIGTPTYVELRYRDASGRLVKKWVIHAGTD